MVRLSAIQLCSTPDVDENIATISQQITHLPQAHIPHIVVLPECCLLFGASDKAQLALAKKAANNNYLIKQLSDLAKTYEVTLVAGSMPVYQAETDKFANSSLIFSPQGELISSYQKLHLFDVEVDDSEKNYCESRFTQAGKQTVVTSTQGVNIGQTICYDLRFPELYRKLTVDGAQVITVPSAFTKVTGKAHWETLLRARAIENQVFIIAAGQQGIHQNGRETWGHSMIISPWGDVLTCLPEGVGAISVEVDMAELDKVRQAIPVAKHNQFTTKLNSYE